MNQKDKKLLEERYNKSIALWRAGLLGEAIEGLLELSQTHPKLATIFGVMGAIHREAGDWDKAVECFQRTVQLSPKSELASRGLFHTLMKLGRKDEAYNETRRFLSVSKSEEYEHLIKDINETLQSDPTSYLDLNSKSSLN